LGKGTSSNKTAGKLKEGKMVKIRGSKGSKRERYGGGGKKNGLMLT